jgi:hypothetical protein
VKRRIRSWTEEELLASLTAQAVDVDLEATAGTGAKLLKEARDAIRRPGADARGNSAPPASPPAVPLLALAGRRADLSGLPFRKEGDCKVEGDAAEAKQAVSCLIRSARAKAAAEPDPRGGNPPPPGPSKRDLRIAEALNSFQSIQGATPGKTEAPTDDAAPTLTQMLQVEDEPVRFELVKLLAATKGEQAGAALARRALFDFAPSVRKAAVEALKDRPPEEYRPVLLDGFRFPWPPAADHAAAALAALQDRDAAPALVEMLDAPDPAGPFRGSDGKWRAAELVRVSHLGNCLLCHAPSFNHDDPLRGVVPRRGEPLPDDLYDGPGDFVRADVTYLRPDLSRMHHVKRPGKWPAVQRFDYLVRTRELTSNEVYDCLEKLAARNGPGTPRREVLLAALRDLTGADPGDSAAAWRTYLKESKADPGPQGYRTMNP